MRRAFGGHWGVGPGELGRELTQVLIALGSNVGDAIDYLARACIALSSELAGARASAVYRTAPMYVLDQPPFLNAAVSGGTEMGPLQLLRRIKGLEAEIGRQAGQRFGPREIDIDLVAYGAARYVFEDGGKTVLEVPHPRVAERRFVLQPLNDLGPETTLPGLGKVADLLIQTNSQESDVVKLIDAVLPIHGPR